MSLFDQIFEPMLLKERESPFNSEEYFFEIKYDGIRALIFVSPNEFKIWNRHQKEITNLYPELKSIQSFVTKPVIFDGEIVFFENGKSNFSKIQERAHLKDQVKIFYRSQKFPVTFVAFDLLYEKIDVTKESLVKRKKRLHKYSDTDYFIKSFGIENFGIKLFEEIKKLGLEGIVAKKKNSIYEINTRSDSWLKIKNLNRDVFVIGGFEEKVSSYVFSVILGEYRDKKLIYVGKVSVAKKNRLYQELLNLKVDKSSFSDKLEGNICWVKPQVKCEIEYLEKTKENKLRQPVFLRKVK